MRTPSEKLLLNETNRAWQQSCFLVQEHSVPATANFRYINQFTLREEAVGPIHHRQLVSDNQEHWQKIPASLKPGSYIIYFDVAY
jgi:hypothetical protein